LEDDERAYFKMKSEVKMKIKIPEEK